MNRFLRILHEAHNGSSSTSAKHQQHHQSRLLKLLPLFIVLAVIVVLAIAAVAFFIFWYYRFLLRNRRNKTIPEDGTLLKIQKYSYRQLKRATRRFSQDRKLGRGGFGVVYRGVLRNGQEVAVKKLDLCSLQGEREFENELSICSGLDCPYVINLLGYCTHGKTIRLLVYERMQNGSLQEALFEKKYPNPLNWEKRFRIILDVARGLQFLHLKCNPPIIHGDVKPSNILLGNDFNAKIADFGLARFKTDDSGIESARSSTSTDKFRLDFVEKSRFAPHDSSSNTDVIVTRNFKQSKNPLFDSCYKPTNTESPSVKQKLLINDSSVTVDVSSATFDGIIPSPSASSVAALNDSQICDVFSVDDLNKPLPDVLEIDILEEAQSASPKKQLELEKSVFSNVPSISKAVNEKAYVMQWLGSELPSGSHVKNKTLKDEIVPVGPNTNRISRTDQPALNSKRKSRRKSREWWKDEYFDELNKKNISAVEPRTNNLRDFLSGELSSYSGELRRPDYRFQRDSPRKARSGELFFYHGYDRRPKTPSDIHCGLGVDSLQGLDLNRSGELISRDASSTTSMRGTVCYIAPEHGGNGVPSEKSDIYSFGVLMLVILSGRRPLQITTSPRKQFEKANLISWARTLSQSGRLLDLMDDRLGGDYDRAQAYLCLTLALLCLQRVPTSRPDISEIVKFLSGEVTPPALPLDLSPSPPARLSFKQIFR